MNANAPDNVDELASALIDGLLDDEQAAEARRDPAVAARADEMRVAQEALRSVPPVNRGRRDQAIAAAMRLHSPPTARHRTPWLAVAAVIVVLLAIGGALATWSVSSSDETATSGDDSAATEEEADTSAAGEEAADEAAEEDAGEAASPPSDGDAPTADQPGEAPVEEEAGAGIADLGAVGSFDELAVHAREALDEPDASRTTGTAADFGCPVPPAVERAGGPVLRGQATLEGERLDVWVYDDGDSLRLLTLDSSCAQVSNQALDG